MAVIDTAAQLHEYSNEAVTTAVPTAVETAARGAKAMGFTQITVKGSPGAPRRWCLDAGASPSDSSSVLAPDRQQDQDEQTLDRRRRADALELL